MLKHNYADINDIRLHYVTAGKGKLLMSAHGLKKHKEELTGNDIPNTRQ